MSKMVLVRTYSAGVHFGDLIAREGKEVRLGNARRIWSWSGANSLHEIAMSGCTGRISVPVKEILLTEAIEVIDMAPEAVAALESVKWK